MINTGIIILAAGQSKRLGSPKQFVKLKDTTLLNNAIKVAQGTKISPIYVVLGFAFQKIQKNIIQKKITIVENENWKSGIASSIVKGLQTCLKEYPKIEKIIFMVCDQPFIHSQLLIELIQEYKKTQKSIIASKYEKILGTPVLFHSSLFPELLNLQGDVGAGKIIKQNTKLVSSISFPEGIKDIDTMQDVKLLQDMLCL